jgi:hypothetical protein
MPPSHEDAESQGFVARVRLTGEERARWTARLEPGESLSDLVRGAVELELRRREEARGRDRSGSTGSSSRLAADNECHFRCPVPGAASSRPRGYGHDPRIRSSLIASWSR